MSAVVLPTLYHTIELKVPLQWSRLPSLEKLLASSSEGFKYTRCLRIVTTQYRREDNTYPDLDGVPGTDDNDVVENEHESGDEEGVDNAEEEEEEGEENDELFKVYHPHISASNALNAFIRVLVVKLPPQQLHSFWYISSPHSILLFSTLL